MATHSPRLRWRRQGKVVVRRESNLIRPVVERRRLPALSLQKDGFHWLIVVAYPLR